MELEIDLNELSSALSLAQGFANSRDSVYGLSAVLLGTTPDKKFFCRATDMVISAEANRRCLLMAEGACSINVRSFFRVLRTFRPGPVLLKSFADVDGSPWLSAKSNRSEFKMMGFPADLFPTLPAPSGVPMSEVSALSVIGLIEKTLFSVSPDENRINLNGALWHYESGRITATSTDGHRLSRHTEDFEGIDPGFPEKIIVPRKGLESILTTMGSSPVSTCAIGSDARHLFLRINDILLTIKLNDTLFPDVTNSLMESWIGPNTVKIQVAREEVLTALDMMSAFTTPKEYRVKMLAEDGVLTFRSMDMAIGEGSKSIDADYQGLSFQADLNAMYLKESLLSFGEDMVTLQVSRSTDPVILTGNSGAEGHYVVLMPLLMR